MSDKKRILMASYGGGHVQSLIPVAKRLMELGGIELEVIGFTTAQAAFNRAGIAARGYSTLLDDADREWIEKARKYMPKEIHADIDEVDSLAYYALGLKDLFSAHGEKEAVRIYSEEGRKAFLPVLTLKKYLLKTMPDLVITSTSPRSELALQYAANDLGITGLAISDLFLQNESSYICASRYAGNISVIARYVSDYLVQNGCDANRIQVLGNPAFDRLHDEGFNRRAKVFRRDLGISGNDKLILWACPSAEFSMIGKPFIKPNVMITFLDDYCSKEDGVHYLVRQHPSKPVVGELSSQYGSICPSDIEIEVCIYAADVVLLETSTVGLQAALVGKPVVSINAGNYPPYAKLDLSVDVNNFDEAKGALRESRAPIKDRLGYANLSCSTDAVVDLIKDLIL